MRKVDQNTIDSWVSKLANTTDSSAKTENMTEEFEAYKETWDKLKEMQEIEQFDTDRAWNNLFSKINKDDVPESKGTVMNLNRNKVFAIAASIAMLLGVTGILSYNNIFSTKSIFNAGTSAQLVELPDGTAVYLNSNSELSYNKAFVNNGVRQVSLKGEAFFDVARDESHPFIINANHSFIKVLGTSFNVNAKSNNVEVVVKTGKVEVYNKNKSIEHVILLPGDKAVLDNTSEISKSTNKKDNYLGWLDRKLVFKAMPLDEVITDLEDTYHTDININDTSIASLKITSTFDNDSLEDILQSIALTFDLNIVKEGKKYTLVSN